MRIFVSIFAIALGAGFHPASSAQSVFDEIYQERPAMNSVPSDLIEGSRWKYRLLVACNYERTQGGNKLYKFNAKYPVEAYHERDLIYVSKHPKTGTAFMPYVQDGKSGTRIRTYRSELEGLSRLAQCRPGENSLSLIGKDGTLKQKWTTPVTDNEIFKLIDAMPMRQQEMRQQKLREKAE